jgi:hypothetical protein
VNFRGGDEATAAYENSIVSAVWTGQAMAREGLRGPGRKLARAKAR